LTKVHIRVIILRMPRSVISGLAIWAHGTVAAHAREASAPFQQDPIEYYGSRFLTAILVFAIGLVLYSVIRYRGRAEGAVSWSLLVAGVGVLPSLSIAFGSLLVFERAERVAFCASCHLAMQAYVDDLENPNSASLAAIHYRNRYIPKNQCYSCHTSFGLFGTVQAKIAGMLDVQKYYTRSFQLPIKMREPYSNTDCLKCHAEAVRWSSAHEQVKDTVFEEEISCLRCHGEENPAHIVSN
jgi:cytochrome c nitrite reductase small subunit